METNPVQTTISASVAHETAVHEVSCPYCRSTETEFFSLFGQQLLTEQYYCNNCRTPFEYVKDDVQTFPKG